MGMGQRGRLADKEIGRQGDGQIAARRYRRAANVYVGWCLANVPYVPSKRAGGDIRGHLGTFGGARGRGRRKIRTRLCILWVRGGRGSDGVG
jgi:hypothetical protein